MLLLFAPIKIVFLFLALLDRHACGRGFLALWTQALGQWQVNYRKQMHVVRQAQQEYQADLKDETNFAGGLSREVSLPCLKRKNSTNYQVLG